MSAASSLLSHSFPNCLPNRLGKEPKKSLPSFTSPLLSPLPYKRGERKGREGRERRRVLAFPICFFPSQPASLGDPSNFPRYITPDFLQYLCERRLRA